MRLSFPQVAAATQVKHADTLGNGPFYPCPLGVASFERWGLLPLTGHLNGFMLGLRTEGHLTRVGSGGGTEAAYWASQAIVLAELGANDERNGALLPLGPFAADVSLRAGHGLSLPIDGKLADVIS